jgi:hypothetical protein
MATIILLKENELTKNTLLGEISTSICIFPALQMPKRHALEEILGETLYNKICDDFDNDDLTGDYLTLYEDYIKPFLISQRR